MKTEVYAKPLNDLVAKLNQVAPSPMVDYFKVLTLTVMNMRYEAYAFGAGSDEHPFLVTKRIIEQAGQMFDQLNEIAFIEKKQAVDDGGADRENSSIIEEHRELWQKIWPQHNEQEFKEFIELKERRLLINDLRPLIDGKACADLGCGNGAFTFAMSNLGAYRVEGIDFGEESVAFAASKAQEFELTEKVEFQVGDVRETNFASDSFDFCVSNGVLHHLGSYQALVEGCKEAYRIIKPGGWFWLYVDGSGAISMDLWDATVVALKKIDVSRIQSLLAFLNVSRNKQVHIVDGSNAHYIHSDRETLLADLASIGFETVHEMIGGESTDFDPASFSDGPDANAKFGKGDVRLVCQKPI